MNQRFVSFGRSALMGAAASCALWLPAVTAHAQGAEDASLARGAQEDATPQQRYQTAIREAGGGLKINLEECKTAAAAERSACNAKARAQYKEEMAAAKVLLKDPNARPLSVTGGPIRSTVTTVQSKP
jgi:hypothetical protein